MATALAVLMGRALAGPALQPGAVEIAVSGSLSSVEGSVVSLVGLRAGRYFGASSSNMRYEIDARLDHQHVGDIDTIDLGAGLSMARRLGTSASYVKGGVVAGLRQEWIGSFNEARYPLGVELGVLSLVGARAGFAVVYAFRRVLGDPVADYNEHRIVVGVLLLFDNEGKNP